MVNEVVSLIREFDSDLRTDECILIAENLLCVYYLNRLGELGLISNGGYKITPDGFDKAMSLIEIGFKVDEEGIWRFIHELIYEEKLDTGDKRSIYELLTDLQNKGYGVVKKEVEELKRNLTEEEEI